VAVLGEFAEVGCGGKTSKKSIIHLRGHGVVLICPSASEKQRLTRLGETQSGLHELRQNRSFRNRLREGEIRSESQEKLKS
jgi:hypothetical protein